VVYLKLLRPKDWAKNLFLYLPLFFSGEVFNLMKLSDVFEGFVAFCCIASSIYIINDYADIENDRIHPEKRKRPLASGEANPTVALVISAFLIIAGFLIAYHLGNRFFSLVGIYFSLNIAYSFGLKNIPILDIIIIAIGFSLRIRSGGALAAVEVTIWMNILVFLLALFMQAKLPVDSLLFHKTATKIAGAVLILIAVFFFLFRSLKRFLQSKNTVLTVLPANSLQTDGIYAVTRNPMYIGLSLLYLGIACVIGNWWNIILFPLLLLIVQEYIIRREEKYLLRRFGQQYLDYKDRVRRWL